MKILQTTTFTTPQIIPMKSSRKYNPLSEQEVA